MTQDLKRTLALPDAVSIVAGSMIGCGIFIVSADIARQVNSGLLLILIWVLAGFITLCGGLSLCELAANITEEGGQYVYLKKIFSEKIAFLYGWTLFLVIQTGTIAAVCVAFAKFFGIIVPFISTNNIIFHISFWNFSTQQLFAILTVITLSFINSRGIQYGVITQNIFTITKIISLAGIVVLGLLFGFNSHILQANFRIPFALTFNTINIIAVAIVGALFASITWNNITFIAGEVKHPQKNIPKALVYGVVLVVSLYLLMNMIYLGVLPIDEIKNAPQDIVAARTISQIFGNIGIFPGFQLLSQRQIKPGRRINFLHRFDFINIGSRFFPDNIGNFPRLSAQRIVNHQNFSKPPVNSDLAFHIRRHLFLILLSHTIQMKTACRQAYCRRCQQNIQKIF